MSFNSYTFILFLAVVLLFHRALPWRAGRILLLVASYIFYGAGTPWHCLLLLTSTVVDFNIARRIETTDDRRFRKGLLAVSLLVNLGLLASFKYGGFVTQSVNVALAWLVIPALPVPDWTLPIGISFYTFQTLSYTVDVYYGKEKATRDFVGFSLYVAFFPQLVAGPIERFSKLMPQLQTKQTVHRNDLEAGFQRILWGLAKKMVVADRLGLFVDRVYDVPADASAPAALAATACFALQVYMDFSGYCDIAIGTARMLGIRLSENFRWPMLARNPADFWSRWHITLGTWFRDYLFTALMIGRRRPPAPRRLLNLTIVMVLMGLWHGPGWNFVLFGLMAGIGISLYEGIYLFTGRSRARPLFGKGPLSVAVAVALMNLHIFTLAILFRSPSIEHARTIVSDMLTGSWSVDPVVSIYAAAAVVIWAGCIARGVFHGNERKEIKMPAALRAGFWMVLLVVLLYGSPDTHQQFIYFQF